MSKTPIFDFVTKYVQSGKYRLHMPGHKGKELLGVEKYDITEIDGADVLYNSKGIIRQSENIASGLFGSGRTVYSCEGSSLSIRAMLYIALLHGKSIGKKPVIFAARNAHKVFVTSSALLDFEIKWLYPENHGLISCVISPDSLDKELMNTAEKPVAVYITSPDYLGFMSDISGLSEVCHKYGVLLLVDNAHGAYLAFCSKNKHPINCGADMCCDSAHKTLPVLTGGGYLHISKDAPEIFAVQAENAMSLFASTSPSYLIMQSIDLANKYILEGYKEKLKKYTALIDALKKNLSECGYVLCGDEPLKLTIAPKSYGYTGTEFSDILEKNGIVCEFSDPDYVTMMFTPDNGEDVIKYVEKTLINIERKEPIVLKAPQIIPAERVITPRLAIFSQSESIAVEDAVGRVLAQTSVSCPPAIPVAVSGERISREAVSAFLYYGITQCEVVVSDKT